jgi:hypothetical protein
MERRRRAAGVYFKGIYEAKPNHFGAVWPGVRTETLVELVFGAIKKRGEAEFEQILDDTKLDEDLVGVALADLMLWRKDITLKSNSATRLYVLVHDELTK